MPPTRRVDTAFEQICSWPALLHGGSWKIVDPNWSKTPHLNLSKKPLAPPKFVEKAPLGFLPKSASGNVAGFEVSAVTHMMVQGRDTHATDRCRWTFLRSIAHMRRGNRPSLLACAPGMMPQGASSVCVAAVFAAGGRSLHFGPTARVRWYRQPLLSVGIAHWVI